MDEEIQGEEEEVQSKQNEGMVITCTRNIEIRKGQVYKDKKTFAEAMSYYAIKNHFQYRTNKSYRRQYDLRCFDEKCEWSLYASRKGETEKFQIKKFNDIHSCPLNLRMSDQRQATSKVVGGIIKYKYMEIKTMYTPRDIVNDMKKDHGITLSYAKAWRSREKALEMIKGKPKDLYARLPQFLYMLKQTNPGSFVNLEINDSKFLYVFMALHALIIGWEHCLLVIVVDGTFLKSAYRGTMLTAATNDAVGKIFPLAFAVVNSENDASWEWFFIT